MVLSSEKQQMIITKLLIRDVYVSETQILSFNFLIFFSVSLFPRNLVALLSFVAP